MAPIDRPWHNGRPPRGGGRRSRAGVLGTVLFFSELRECGTNALHDAVEIGKHLVVCDA